jgi:hypothetical protein
MKISYVQALEKVMPETEYNSGIGVACYLSEGKEVIFCGYITSEDTSWKTIFEQQNPVAFIGYYSHDDFYFGDPDSEIDQRVRMLNTQGYIGA